MSDIKLPLVATSDHPEFPVLAWSPLELAEINRLMSETVRLNAQAVPEISTEHGPWVESNIHEGETYCKRCLVRSVFAGHKKCEPHIVSAPAAPQPAQQSLAEKDALLRQALEALEPFELSTSLAERTAEAIRNHLGVKND